MRIARVILSCILLTGCVTDSKDAKLVSVTSFAQPSIIAPPAGSVSIVDYVALQWQESDPSITSFNLYYSDTGPHVYEHVANCTNMFCVISNMPVGATWYFAATAVDSNGVESDLSDQYAFTMNRMLDIGFVFTQPVTPISVQSSTDLITWRDCKARLRSNGLWRVNGDSSAQFYRGVAQ